jgi:hypothetical protein
MRVKLIVWSAVAIAFMCALVIGNGPMCLAQDRDKDTRQMEKDFKLMNSERLGSLQLGMSEAEVLKVLGPAESKSKDALWGADGLYHQSWKYGKKGIELNMDSRKPSGKKIAMITIVYPCTFATTRGIKIGSSAKEVKSAYSDYIHSDTGKDSITAGTCYGGIIFSLKNSKVVRIFIGAAAE